ncbi:MAG TPA: EthD family reductase [Steroidobacteraceae bacterium]|nr:EthD family reductase [Steroidobacteraceae bacterium]
MRCITVLYPNKEGVRFDFDYYKKKHATLIMRLYGKGISKYELRKGLSGPDGGKPTYVATVNFWIGDQKLFDEAQGRHTQELIADVPNFTNVQPTIQFDEVADQQ